MNFFRIFILALLTFGQATVAMADSPVIWNGTRAKSLTPKGFVLSTGATIDGEGAKNYALNPSGFIGTTNWTTANGVTLTRVTTGLPRANTTGVGLTLAAGTATTGYAQTCFTVDTVDQNKVLGLSWAQVPASYTSGDFRIQVYNFATAGCGGAATLLSLPSDTSGFTGIPNSSQTINLSFYANGATAFYGVRFLRQTGTSALTISDLYAGPGTVVQGANVGPWQSYTPTLNGFGTATGLTAFYRIVGTSIQGIITFTAGTTTASTASFTLPNSYTPNSSVYTSANVTQIGTWNRGTSTASNVKTGLIVVNPNNGNTPFFTYNDYTTAASPVTLQQASNIIGTGQYVELTFDVAVNELAGGTVNLAQNDLQYYYPIGGTWGTSNGSLTTGQGQGGVLGGTTTPAVTQFQFSFFPSLPVPVGAKPFIEVSPDQLHWQPLGGLSGTNNVMIENGRNDGTNYIGIGISNLSTGQFNIIFGKYPTGTATTWSTIGTWYYRVTVGLPGQAVAFAAYVPGQSSGLVPSVGLPGATSGLAPCSGCVGESIRSIAGVTITSTITDVTSVSVPPGIWDMSSVCSYTGFTSAQAFRMFIGTASGAVTTGLVSGDNEANMAFTSAVISASSQSVGLSIPSWRYLNSSGSNATLYLKSNVTTATGTVTATCRLSGIRAA